MQSVSLVCPTYVGMNRYARLVLLDALRMPHVCGDEPGYYVMLVKMILYAPRMWG